MIRDIAGGIGAYLGALVAWAIILYFAGGLLIAAVRWTANQWGHIL